MTKLFGEYLVEKGVVKKTELLSALISQIKSTPSAVEVAFEKNLLDHDILLNVLLKQHHDKVNFSEALKKISPGSTSIISEIEKIISLKKEPLGEILIKLGASNLDAIADALDNFLTETKFEPEQKQNQEKIVPHVESSNETSTSNYSTYLEQFTLESYLELKILFSLTNNINSLDKFVPKAIDMLQVLRGSARFVQLNYSENIIKAMINSLEKIINSGQTAIEVEVLTKIENYVLDALDFLFQIRESLENSKTEENQKNDTSWVLKFESICKGV